MRLVTEGIARINFKSNSSTNYLLKERGIVKEALARLDKEIQSQKAMRDKEIQRQEAIRETEAKRAALKV